MTEDANRAVCSECGQRKPVHENVSDAWLRTQYLEQMWSIRDIAKHIGRSYTYARNILLQAGVALRSKS